MINILITLVTVLNAVGIDAKQAAPMMLKLTWQSVMMLSPLTPLNQPIIATLSLFTLMVIVIAVTDKFPVVKNVLLMVLKSPVKK